jgi:putative inorganic carbon (HCO3(-)) transporter
MNEWLVESEASGQTGPVVGLSQWGGPALRSTLWFLAAPALLAVTIIVLDVRLPGWALYGIAGVMGLVLVLRVATDAEWLLALCVLYCPLNKIYVVPLAPGINGTNALMLLMLFAWGMHVSREDRPVFRSLPNSGLVGTYGAITLISVVTASITLGFGHLMTTYLGDIKSWLDQFIVFFVFLNLIRDARMARRIVLYLMLGALVTLALGFQEWLDKRLFDSIDKSRVFGPQLQPNDYGAFLSYMAAPFIALFVTNLGRIRAWFVLFPVLLAIAKILLATFSRGAYVGMALCGVVAGYVRGKLFLVGSGVLALGFLIAMPQLIPESLSARMAQTTTDVGATEQLDDSSQTRLILWEAAIDMTMENPVFGKGFKTFPELKGQYTKIQVHESDNHNMYLYVASQMGVPAVVTLLLIFWRMYSQGVQLYRRSEDPFARAIGMGAAAMVACIALANMFGSRMVDISVTAYFWIYLAALSHMTAQLAESNQEEELP